MDAKYSYSSVSRNSTPSGISSMSAGRIVDMSSRVSGTKSGNMGSYNNKPLNIKDAFTPSSSSGSLQKQAANNRMQSNKPSANTMVTGRVKNSASTLTKVKTSLGTPSGNYGSMSNNASVAKNYAPSSSAGHDRYMTPSSKTSSVAKSNRPASYASSKPIKDFNIK